MIKPGKMSSPDGSVIYYADSIDDVPVGTPPAEPYNIGDSIIAKAEGTEGIVVYMLFPSGWWKVG